jgi:hypothetical protein
MMKQMSRIAALCLLMTGPLAAAPPASQPVALGSRRELMVDRSLIETLRGGEIRLHTPRDEGIAIRFDRPWEGRFCGYATVIASSGREGEPRFRAYYRGLPAIDDAAQVTCMAVSEDGIHWVKPELSLFPHDGNRRTNIVLAGDTPATHNFSPLLDTRPGVPTDERYKALGGTAKSGLLAFVSADGTDWRKLQDEPVLTDTGWVFDSQNIAFWSASEGKYVAYYRKSPAGRRAIARATSDDFLHWSKPEMMVYSDTGTAVPSHHLYTNQTSPYCRAPHLYVAIAARFIPGRQVISARQAGTIGVDPKYFGDVSDAILMTSRGGNTYDRTFPQAFLRPGIGAENWVSRTNYPALNVVQTGPAEMSFYVNQNYGQPTAHLRRYSLRLDGFASVHAPAGEAELITKPLTFAGNQLQLNFSTSAAGGIRVEVQDLQGKALPGLSLADSRELIGNEIDGAVQWRDAKALAAIAGRPVRLRLQLRDADLFALRFATAK